jgi:chitin disaccharide deacetylase
MAFPPIRLIIGADDFGWTRGINRGILEAHANGIVTATSLMVNAPFAREAVASARAYPSLELGIHLDLRDNLPVLPPRQIPSLVEASGRFRDFRQLCYRAMTRQLNVAEIVAEFRAQIGRALEMGIVPSHVDSHHHVHILPAIFRALPLAMAGLLDVPVRGYNYRLVFAEDRPRWRQLTAYYLRNPRRLATHRWAAMISRYFRRRGLKGADRMLIPVREPGKPPAKLSSEGWRRLIAEACAGSVNEVFCHPGYVDDGFCGKYRMEREQELRALTSPDVRRAVQEGNVQLCGYSAIGAIPGTTPVEAAR